MKCANLQSHSIRRKLAEKICVKENDLVLFFPSEVQVPITKKPPSPMQKEKNQIQGLRLTPKSHRPNLYIIRNDEQRRQRRRKVIFYHPPMVRPN